MLTATNEGLAAIEHNTDGTVAIAQIDGAKLGLGGDWYVNLVSCNDDDHPTHPLITLIKDRKVRITIEVLEP